MPPMFNVDHVTMTSRRGLTSYRGRGQGVPGHEATPTPTLLYNSVHQVYQLVLVFVNTLLFGLTLGVEVCLIFPNAHDRHFFAQTEVTIFAARLIRRALLQNGIFDSRVRLEALVPHIFGEGGGRLFVKVIE